MDLVIDGNYILNRNVFSLVKDRLLYSNLYDSFSITTNSYVSWYPFDNVYFISDADNNWRKKYYPEYKGTRKKSTEIDWAFAYQMYRDYKTNLPPRIKLLEQNWVEGDDWFHYISKRNNAMGRSTMMVSNDGDLKQLLITGKNFINMMANENTAHNVFLPDNYKTWLANYYNNIPLPTIFDDISNESLEFVNFFKQFISNREILTYKHDQVIFEKIISGDRGDNVKTVWSKTMSNGKERGIGDAGANKIYNQYIEYFGEPDFSKECFNRLCDLIIESKKLDSGEYDKIMENIKKNNNLVNLDRIPSKIKQRMAEAYERVNEG